MSSRRLSQRVLPKAFLFLVAAAGVVVSLACNTVPALDKKTLVDHPCKTDADCPLYLGCLAQTKCVPRCGGENSQCDPAGNGFGGSGLCHSGLCDQSTSALGNGANGPSTGSTSPTASGSGSCVVGGELLRGDAPPIGTASSAALAFDDSHLYVSQVQNDNLGNPKLTIDAYPMAGGTPTAIRPAAAPSGFSVPQLYRSGSWLYIDEVFGSNGVTRTPAPPATGVTPVESSVSFGSTGMRRVVLGTPQDLVVALDDGLVRVNGETGAVIDTTPLDSSVTTMSPTADRLYWPHPNFPAGAPDGGGPPVSTPAAGGILYAPLKSGPAVRTGVILPSYTSAFVIAGTDAFIESPNGTLQKVDTTTPGAQPVTIHPPPSVGTLATDGSALLAISDSASTGCASLSRVDPASGATSVIATLASTYYAMRTVGLRGGYFYWLNGPELRRVHY